MSTPFFIFLKIFYFRHHFLYNSIFQNGGEYTSLGHIFLPSFFLCAYRGKWFFGKKVLDKKCRKVFNRQESDIPIENTMFFEFSTLSTAFSTGWKMSITTFCKTVFLHKLGRKYIKKPPKNHFLATFLRLSGGKMHIWVIIHQTEYLCIYPIPKSGRKVLQHLVDKAVENLFLQKSEG